MKYTNLLPFMEEEELREVANEIISGELKGVKLQTLFPFLGREDLHEIVDKLIEKGETSAIQSAIPFISKDKVLDIYNAARDGKLPNFDASRCLPFLSSDKIKEIFRELAKNAPDEEEEEFDD